MRDKYYIDTCIYLNLWQKEVVEGVELWRLAEEFFDKIEEREDTIYYSGFILKRSLQKCQNFSKRSLTERNLAFIASANFKNFQFLRPRDFLKENLKVSQIDLFKLL